MRGPSRTAPSPSSRSAEALKATGTEVVFDDWWPEHTDDLEWHIAQLAASRTVFFLLTREYFEHTSLAVEAGRFRATWVEDELSFVRHVYQTQLESHPKAGAVIDATGLLLDPDREPIPWFSRLFDLRTPERWQAFLASFDGLRVHRLTAAERAEIRAEAQAHAKAFVAGHEPEAFSGLARLAGRFPFVGDLAVMLVTMAREVGDFERARQVAELGVRSTEPWRWEHRWLRSRATMGPD